MHCQTIVDRAQTILQLRSVVRKASRWLFSFAPTAERHHFGKLSRDGKDSLHVYVMELDLDFTDGFAPSSRDTSTLLSSHRTGQVARLTFAKYTGRRGVQSGQYLRANQQSQCDYKNCS